MISADQLDDLKARNPCNEVAARWVTLRKAGRAWVGPCPMCSTDPAKKKATKFKVTSERWMCAVCMDGGDVIELVRKVEGRDFAGAVEWLGGAQDIDAEEAARRKAERDAKQAAQEKTNADFRERERGTVYDIWTHASKDLAGSSVERYAALRGLAGAPLTGLRCIEEMPYFDSGKAAAEVIHRGPAMVAAFVRGGRFSGLHLTYLDLAQPKGKLKLQAADGDEWPAKKMRGSKTGAHIALIAPPKDVAPRRIFIGEGIETVLSIWCALHLLGLLREGDAFYVSGDLGNLGGKAADSVPHPTAKTDKGRTRRVPGPVPEAGSPGIVLPDTADEVIILGDGDSDPFTTRCHLARAAARFDRPGRSVRVAFSADGTDFNDMWRAGRDVQTAGIIADLIAAAGPLTAEDVLAAAESTPAPESAEPIGEPPAAEAHDPGASFSEANEGEPQRRPGARSANRARWGGPPRKYGGGDDGLNRWLAHFPMTELGLIERYVQRNKHRLKYCEAIGWLTWDGQRWAREGAAALAVSAGHDVVRAIQDEAEAIRDTEFDGVRGQRKPKGAKKDDPPIDIMLSDLLEAFGRASEKKAVMTLEAHARPYLSVEVEQLDADPFAINLQNGTLLLRRDWSDHVPAGWIRINKYARLKPHDPADLITKLMPVKFDRTARCPRYDKFLLDVQPLYAVREFLDDWDGYSMTGDVGEQKLTFHYGTGKNGKSTWLVVRLALLGDYGRTIPIETFINDGKPRAGGSASPDLAMLRKVRGLATSEPDKGWRLNEALIKLLTGGDPVQVRELHKPYFTLVPEFKLTIAGNHKPNISGGDAESGTWRRVVLVPWAVRITEAQRDPHLTDKLKLEGSGILNRWIAGLARWMERGLMVPDEVAAATEKFRLDSDHLGRFMAGCTEPAPGDRVQSSHLYEVYVAWAKANGAPIYFQTGFSNALIDRGYSKETKHFAYWLDLRLTKDPREFAGAYSGGGDERDHREPADAADVPF